MMGAYRAAPDKLRRVIHRVFRARVDDFGHLEHERFEFSAAPVALEHQLLERRLRLEVLRRPERIRERRGKRLLRLLRIGESLGCRVPLLPRDGAVRVFRHRRSEIPAAEAVKHLETFMRILGKLLQVRSDVLRKLRGLCGLLHGGGVHRPRRAIQRLEQKDVELSNHIRRARRSLMLGDERLAADRHGVRLRAAGLYAADVPDIADADIADAGIVDDWRQVVAESYSVISAHCLILAYTSLRLLLFAFAGWSFGVLEKQHLSNLPF